MKPSKLLSKKSATTEEGSSLVPRSLWNEFNENMPQLFPWTAPWTSPSASWPAAAAFKAPAVDVAEDDKEVAVKAEIPGLSEKDLEVSYADGVLYLKGEKKGEKEEKKRNTWHRESWQGFFSRSIPIGREVEWEKAKAKHKDGVLTVIIPKTKGKENHTRINIE